LVEKKRQIDLLDVLEAAGVGFGFGEAICAVDACQFSAVVKAGHRFLFCRGLKMRTHKTGRAFA